MSKPRVQVKPTVKRAQSGRSSSKNNILGFLDRIDEAGFGGWTIDIGNPAHSFRMRVLIDDIVVDVVTCDLNRDDAALLKLPISRIGFYYNIPERYHDGLRHVIKFASVEGIQFAMASPDGGAMAELHFCLPKPVRVEGFLDGMIDGIIQGWALNINDRANTKFGNVRILVTHGGQPVAELTADQYRADVAQAVGSEAACGFVFAPPPELRLRKRAEFRFFAMPGRQELQGSPITIAFPEENERERIVALIARADELFTFAYHMRRELKASLPGERYLIGDYGRWVARSLPMALPRAIARYGELPEKKPLISILCPVFRPNIGDFLAAIDSVRAQTYANWELLLVDDASGDGGLEQTILQLSASDNRIKFVFLKKNGGIGHATNIALANANGELVAFLDHDDVLEVVALEIMVRAHAATGAQLLYSDEDKIDRSGLLSEPHLKPDFNYRFLLEVNFICHFVLIDVQLVRRVGGLDSRFDGAQDHDLLLRICEILEPERIHHVAEILYHWRKSSSSTAAAGSAAKPGAVTAGQHAVSAHLKRRKIPAEVLSRKGSTCYQVKWRLTGSRRTSATISIIIPFRDHVDMTLECLNSIRRYTSEVTYEIILLDNWSVTPEAEKFVAEQGNLKNTRVIRITEPFNFSRINNIGAKTAQGEYILFLNNDVIVRDPVWLRTMLDECLVNDRVAAVGAKLLYPTGTVQHGGVVLGVGGVADHAFRGIPGAAPGYVMRAIAAQEISAVTAACMLVRRSAFEQVGGFDETELTIAFNDVDLCLKFSRAGWKIMFTPDALAEHRESVSRGDDFDESKIARFMFENEAMRQRYKDILPFDPFYNQHFSRDGGVYKELRIIDP